MVVDVNPHTLQEDIVGAAGPGRLVNPAALPQNTLLSSITVQPLIFIAIFVPLKLG
jgi:hypothetical protein